MGFDLTGKNGNSFRNNVWWWRPLWTFVGEKMEDIISDDDYNSGTFNDGGLIDREQSIQISERLDKMLKNGEVKKYELERDKRLNDLPLEDCELCGGTGTRNDDIVQNEKCNGCSGNGKRKSFELNYGFDEENVKEFKEFVEDSGGFEIW